MRPTERASVTDLQSRSWRFVIGPLARAFRPHLLVLIVAFQSGSARRTAIATSGGAPSAATSASADERLAHGSANWRTVGPHHPPHRSRRGGDPSRARGHEPEVRRHRPFAGP